MFTVITPTGDRLESLIRCARWMAEQTIKPDQWLVVDDGKYPTAQILPEHPEVGSFVHPVWREPQPNDPIHTLVTNVAYALPHIAYNQVIVFEDDDYYAPTYLETMLGWLNKADLVGQIPAHYYHVGLRRYKVFSNTSHASFCQTAFRLSEVMPALKWALSCTNPRTVHQLDIRLWKAHKGTKYLGGGKPLCLGLKGLDGRQGLSHWQKLSAWSTDSSCPDPDLDFLKEHLGSAVRYLFLDDIEGKKHRKEEPNEVSHI